MQNDSEHVHEQKHSEYFDRARGSSNADHKSLRRAMIAQQSPTAGFVQLIEELICKGQQKGNLLATLLRNQMVDLIDLQTVYGSMTHQNTPALAMVAEIMEVACESVGLAKTISDSVVGETASTVSVSASVSAPEGSA